MTRGTRWSCKNSRLVSRHNLSNGDVTKICFVFVFYSVSLVVTADFGAKMRTRSQTCFKVCSFRLNTLYFEKFAACKNTPIRRSRYKFIVEGHHIGAVVKFKLAIIGAKKICAAV